jgi:hypothetical protein
MKLSLGILIMLNMTFTISQAELYVADINDFKSHIQNHQIRVLQLGSFLANHNFPELPIQQVQEFLSLHDQSKTSDKMLNALFLFYGKKATESLTSNQSLILSRIIEELNASDLNLIKTYFEEHNISSDDQNKLFLIEKIADSVDRAMDPIAEEEFGRKLQFASDFLGTEFERSLAKTLESNYLEITEHTSEKWLSRSRLSQSAQSSQSKLCSKIY